MTEAVEALYSFFGQFDLPVYPEDGVPGTVTPPYITVRMAIPAWRDTATFYARVWDRAASRAGVLEKVDAIGEAIGEGALVKTEHGCVVIGKGTPFAQLMPYPGDVTLHCVYLNMTIQVLTP